MKGLLSLAGIILVACLVLLYLFGTVVPPGYFGVRQISFGPAQGYRPVGLKPGYHWTVPFYSKVHLVPHTKQQLHLSRDEVAHADTPNALEVQTTDGATVDVDITVVSHFFSEPGELDGIKHGGPADLITNIGLSQPAWENHVLRAADDELRRALGKLTTGEFYNPHLREDGVTKALVAIKNRVAPYGVGVDSILLRRYTYRAQQIDDAIFSKNLQDQEERYNAMNSKLAEVEAELKQVEAQGEAKNQTLRVEGENRAKVLRSEGDLYEAEMVAKGDLAVAKAVAEVDRLRAGVLASSAGSENYVARELAPLLGSLKGGVVRDVDPYNLEQWMKRLGIGGEKAQ